MRQIAQGILARALQHGDETGGRHPGTLHWLHVNSTRHPDVSGLVPEATRLLSLERDEWIAE